MYNLYMDCVGPKTAMTVQFDFSANGAGVSIQVRVFLLTFVLTSHLTFQRLFSKLARSIKLQLGVLSANKHGLRKADEFTTT